MKVYLVEVEDVICVIKAKSKYDAASIVEKRFSISYITPDYVKKLPKKGIIYEGTRPHHHHKIRDI